MHRQFASPDFNAETRAKILSHRRVVSMTQARGKVTQRREEAQVSFLNNSVVKYRSMRSAKTVTTCGCPPSIATARCAAA